MSAITRCSTGTVTTATLGAARSFVRIAPSFATGILRQCPTPARTTRPAAFLPDKTGGYRASHHPFDRTQQTGDRRRCWQRIPSTAGKTCGSRLSRWRTSWPRPGRRCPTLTAWPTARSFRRLQHLRATAVRVQHMERPAPGQYEAYRQLAGSREFAALNGAQQKALNNVLRDFRLAGVALPMRRSSSTRNCASACRNWAASSVTTCWMPPMPGANRSARATERPACDRARQCPAGGAAGGPRGLPYHPGIPVLLSGPGLLRGRRAAGGSLPGQQHQGLHRGTTRRPVGQLRHHRGDPGIAPATGPVLGLPIMPELSLATKMAETPAQVREFLEQLSRQSAPGAS